MLPDEIIYAQETPAHDAEIEILNAQAFGPGRFTRASHFIREGGPHDRALSFVALQDGRLIADVRLTPIMIGTVPALLLGPLVVRPDFKNLGIGKKLMVMALDAAAVAGHRLVVLVGDEPYYRNFGFIKVKPGTMEMPAPVNPERLLARELRPGSLKGVSGRVRHQAQAGG